MNRSTPGLPVHHQLPEFTQTHSIESVMPSTHLIFCHPLLLLPPIRPSIRVFYSESTPLMRWHKYWSFSFSISTSSEYSGLILDRKISQEKPRTENSFPSNWDLVMYQYLVLPLKIQDWGRMPHSHFLSPQMLRQLFSFLLLQDMDWGVVQNAGQTSSASLMSQGGRGGPLQHHH